MLKLYTGVSLVFMIVVNSLYAQRFAGIDYTYTTAQTPISENYNLEGEWVTFTTLSADISYPWFLGKEKDTSLIYMTLYYSQIKSTVHINDSLSDYFKSTLPEYLYEFPFIRNVSLLALYHRTFGSNWQINAGLTAILSSDFENKLSLSDFNNMGVLYLQRKLANFSLGAGVVFFLIDGRPQVFPLGSILYERKEISLDFMPPLTLGINYKITNYISIIADGSLDFGGFEVDYNNSKLIVSASPDYASTTDLNLSLGIDHNFYDTFHWKLQLGYLYQELNYLQANKSIDVLRLQDGITFAIGIYSTF